MRTRVKICCISSVEEARIAIAAGADALGLVGTIRNVRPYGLHLCTGVRSAGRFDQDKLGRFMAVARAG